MSIEAECDTNIVQDFFEALGLVLGLLENNAARCAEVADGQDCSP